MKTYRTARTDAQDNELVYRRGDKSRSQGAKAETIRRAELRRVKRQVA